MISTPGRGMLEGITRRTAMALAEPRHGVAVERALTPEQARGADEVFITGTSGGIMPVIRIDGIPGNTTTLPADYRDPDYSQEIN